MKYIFIFLSTLLLFSCASRKEVYDAVRITPKQKLTPPGTVWLKDNLFMDETEIYNFSYLEFLYWMYRKEPNKANTMLPDTACWKRADIGDADDIIKYYFRHPATRYYPVVGISYEQAVEFCNWRTDRVNEFLYIKENKLKHNADSNYAARAPKKVKYRLPTKEEWEYAAAAGLDYCNFPMGYERLTDKYNLPVSNTEEYYNYFNKDYAANSLGCNDTIFLDLPTEKVYFGKCNQYGLYNMLGNISEIITDNLVKGLNFSMPIYSIERDGETDVVKAQSYDYKQSTKYKRPESWIGFRCVCEVLIK